MSTPSFFQLFDLPAFDARYGSDPAFTRRCDSVATDLYRLLASEVRFLRQVPGDFLDASTLDLCHCAGVLVDSIPFDGWTVEASCEREAPQLYKLARRFHEYRLCGKDVHRQLGELFTYVLRGECLDAMVSAS
ncbi:hypothetical protein WDW37_21580 [Bdellovibrionota bacterium FG-1]